MIGTMISMPKIHAFAAACGARNLVSLGRTGVIVAATAALSACVVAPPRRAAYATPPQVARPAMYFYPAQGQNEERQDRDRFECYQWAKGQTGTDPGMTPVRIPAPPRSEPQVTGAGAAVGAAAGAVVGAASTGPRYYGHRGGGGGGEQIILGAIIGGILGAAAESAGAQAQARAEDARAQHYYATASAGSLDAFQRAMGACMSSRGYTIG